jgi:hypothetical protein
MLALIALAVAVGVGLVALLGAVVGETRSAAAAGVAPTERLSVETTPAGFVSPAVGVSAQDGNRGRSASARTDETAASTRPLPAPPRRPGAPTTIQVAPEVLSADSTDEALRFTFTAGSNLRGTLAVTVPAGWSAPQVDDDQGAGRVTVAPGGCRQMGAPAISGEGPWTVSVDVDCNTGRSMTLVYGAGGALLPAPTAGDYTFTTAFTGDRADAIAVQPMVRVVPGAATALTLSHVDTATAGVATDVSLLVQDQFGNRVTGYTGTVSLTSTDPEATVPDPVVFGPTDAGEVTLSAAVTHRTAAAQTLTASDLDRPVLTDSVEVVVEAGEIAQLILRGDAYYALSDIFLPMPSPYIPSARDEFGNLVTAPYEVKMSVSPGTARLSGGPLPGTLSVNRTDGEIAFPVVQFGTPGPQRLMIELVGRPEITASVDVVVFDGRTSEFKVEDPYLTGETRIRVNPLAAWLTDMPGGAIAPTAQPTFTRDGVTYQLGELSVAPEGHDLFWDLDPDLDPAPGEAPPGRDLVWDLNPAPDAVPADPSHTLLRCDGAAPCAAHGVLVGATEARYSYTFASGRTASGGLDLEIVGEGRDVSLAPPNLEGQIPFTIGPLGLTATGAHLPWNTSLSVTSVADKGLLTEVGILIPQASGIPISGTVDLYSSANLVTGSQIVLEQPLEVIQGPQTTFGSVRILGSPPPPGIPSTTPQLTLQTAVMLNFGTNTLPDGRMYQTMPNLWGSTTTLEAWFTLSGYRWDNTGTLASDGIRTTYDPVFAPGATTEISYFGCPTGMVVGQNPSAGTTLVQPDLAGLESVPIRVDLLVCGP